MASKCPCERELAQLVAHHIFDNENLVEYLAVVHQKGKTHELRNHGASSRPGFYWLTGAGANLFINLPE